MLIVISHLITGQMKTAVQFHFLTTPERAKLKVIKVFKDREVGNLNSLPVKIEDNADVVKNKLAVLPTVKQRITIQMLFY